MRYMRRSLIFFGFLAVLNPASLAQAQILIEEGKLNLSGKRGDTITNTISVHNTSDQTINVRAYWEDFVYVAPFDGKKEFSPAATNANSISKFTNFFPADFTLGPFARKKISYSVKIPRVASGGYYGVLFFERSGQNVKDQTGINLITRVGCLFFLETENQSRAAQVNLGLEDKKIAGDFLNSGNVILVVDAVYYVMNSDGLVLDRGSIGKFYLPPQAKSVFAVKISPQLPAGHYTLVMTFDLGKGDTLVKEADFSKDATGALMIKELRD